MVIFIRSTVAVGGSLAATGDASQPALTPYRDHHLRRQVGPPRARPLADLVHAILAVSLTQRPVSDVEASQGGAAGGPSGKPISLSTHPHTTRCAAFESLPAFHLRRYLPAFCRNC